MKKILQISLMMPVLALLLAVGAGCKEKGPMEKAGESVDKSVEKAKDAVKEGADKAKEVAK